MPTDTTSYQVRVDQLWLRAKHLFDNRKAQLVVMMVKKAHSGSKQCAAFAQLILCGLSCRRDFSATCLGAKKASAKAIKGKLQSHGLKLEV